MEIDGLLTEAVNAQTTNIDQLDTSQLLAVINQEDKTVAGAVEQEIPHIAAAVDTITTAIRSGGRLIYLGAGTSGRLGVLDAAECPPTFGVRPGLVVGLIAGGEQALVTAVEGAEDQYDGAVEQLRTVCLTAGDVVVGLAASGRTPYVIGGLEYANTVGAFTVAISCTPGSAVAKAAKLAITPLVGPEVITGSTRMKAGTAQKLILNMLTTATMIRLGKVYGNLMVDVQPTNAKLIERAKRIVAQVTGVSREQAGEVLVQAGQNPKTAIVMIKRQCTAEQASRYLTAAGGFIRKAVTIQEREITE
ncbi:N-acetylmuramic acid 6-phosphate etherase [Sporomusa acidovorans]|uniref:N-acetylmuramic acid 6-phosphate etherase n=1 Tax=Sporomusa acidovorans TaxID=112900 RepID=UPI000B83FDC5